MKKVGIVVDNYKLEKFRKELIKNGFNDFEEVKFTSDTTAIKVNVPIKKIMEIKKICEKMELYFKRSN